jgi:ribokinase
VIGSINVDLVVAGAPLPGPGETVIGGTFSQHQGGKGGNQAVAAARALAGTDARVAMIGAVGEDAMGADALAALAAEGIETDQVAGIGDIATGIALICVDASGENQIVVASGANAGVSPDQVLEALEALQPTVILANLEVPVGAVQAGTEWSRDHGATFVLNPAPALPEAGALAALSDVVTPNEIERLTLGDLAEGTTWIVETRGAQGVRIVRPTGSVGTEDIAAPDVQVVDTTGAGDCFNGVLAAGLLEGLPVREATVRAVRGAALATTAPGAREGMPTRARIDEASAVPD